MDVADFEYLVIGQILGKIRHIPGNTGQNDQAEQRADTEQISDKPQNHGVNLTSPVRPCRITYRKLVSGLAVSEKKVQTKTVLS